MCSLGVISPAVAAPQEAEELVVESTIPRTAARELIEITNAADLVVATIDTLMPVMIDQVREQHPGLNEEMLGEFQTAFREEVNASIGEYIDLQAAIYERYFTEEELQALVEFYRTPLGQKTIETMPAILNEVLALGSTWGKEMGVRAAERAAERLRERGIDL